MTTAPTSTRSARWRYEMLVGAPPFGGRSAAAVLAAHARETPTPIERAPLRRAARAGALIMQCLEKEPERRPKSGSHLVRALDDSAISGGRPAVGRSRRRSLRRWAWVVVALGLRCCWRRGGALARRPGSTRDARGCRSGGPAAGRRLGRRAGPADPAGRCPRGGGRPLARVGAHHGAEPGAGLPDRLAPGRRRAAAARRGVRAGRYGAARAHAGAGEPAVRGREPRLDHVGDRAAWGRWTVCSSCRTP